MRVTVSPATEGGRADTQQYGGWDTELDYVPVEGLVSTRYIFFVIKRVTFFLPIIYTSERWTPDLSTVTENITTIL